MAFLDAVKASGVTDPDVLAAMAEVFREKHHPPEYAPLAGADIPLPTHPREVTQRPSPSPAVHGLLLQLLELEPRLRVAVVDGDPYALALAERLAAPGEVLGVAALIGAAVQPPFDRLLCLTAAVADAERFKGLLEDGGFAVFPRFGVSGPEVVKLLRGGTEFLEMRFTSLGPIGVGIPRQDAVAAGGLARSLAVNRLMENAWTGTRDSPHDEHFAEVVSDTFEDPEVVKGRLPAEEYRRWEIARKAFACAYIRQSVGDLEAAADAYQASLAVRRTAEAHTFLGWTRSFQGKMEAAIEECHKAIAADPSFGNPYNDIGAYLLELGRVDESIPWFEKAKTSERYCCHFYAYSNLGRAYLLKGMPEKARREFEEALKINPGYEFAREMLRRMGRGADHIA
ncbi:MAG TPA: tetratricopeptide repeat protein [Thermoplasmata archaeon]|nr:tetratricopeptide repeat protein [Thermoplasmata archaeon]